jgi:hypothetical protein
MTLWDSAATIDIVCNASMLQRPRFLHLCSVALRGIYFYNSV